MAVPSKIRLRSLWFAIHKWLGITLAVLVVPISLTGSALVWHDWLDETINPQRHDVTGPVSLPPSAYAEAARRTLAPGERLQTIGFPSEHGPVTVTAARPQAGGGRPVRTLIWLDPASARILDRAGSNEGLVRLLHSLHGSLMVPGVGRQMVGWVGVAMLISSLTGLWLWWPVGGGFRRGLRWRRHNTTNANLHHLAGFWIALPLAMLSFTGVWISFPGVFGTTASAPKGQPSAPPQPLVETRLTPDAALEAARPHATGPLVSIAWPTDRTAQWTVAFRRSGGTAEVKVEEASGRARPPAPPRPETTA
ncbi:MAG: hypothetical protein QOC65_1286, partial [Sphingomonadales bacterium]|nr:hypothetical protein [Sphingomonadales bacterium]